MSGRPEDPEWDIPTWAPDANYGVSANPWSATPTKVTHPGAASVGFTPKAGVPAQCVNKLINEAYATDGSSKTFLEQLIEYLGQLPALNFTTSVDPSGTSYRAAAYDETNRRWYLVGESGNVLSSYTNGWTWDSSSLIATPADETEKCSAIDIDATGNVVVATDSASVFCLNWGTATWTKVSTGASGTFNASGGNNITWDPVHSLWCWIGNDIGAGNQTEVFTSPDRSAWTSRTGPSGWGGYNPVRSVCKKSTGRTMVAALSGTDVKISTSDDGGITWTNRAGFTTGIASATEFFLAYNPDTNVWLLTVGEVSGTPSCENWISLDDGVSWNWLTDIQNHCLIRPAPMGHLWLACSRTTSELAYSIDNGESWYFTGYLINTTAVGVFANKSQFLVLTTGLVYPGFRANKPGLAAIA